MHLAKSQPLVAIEKWLICSSVARIIAIGLVVTSVGLPSERGQH
jgi:hypothetical protein